MRSVLDHFARGRWGALMAMIVGSALMSPLACSLIVGGDLTGGVITADGGVATDAGAPLDSTAVAAESASEAESGPLGYAATVLSDAPVGYWRLGEKVGASSAASEVGSFACPLNGSVTWGATGALDGDSNSALQLDGQGGIDCGDRFDFSGTHAYTLEVWLHTDALDTTYRCAFAKNDSQAAGGQASYAMWVHQGDGLAFERFVGGTAIHVSAPFATDAIFHHVVAVYSGSELQLYLDGSSIMTMTDTRSSPSIAAPFTMGSAAQFFGTPFGFKGALDELAVYDKALSADRIGAHFHAAGR